MDRWKDGTDASMDECMDKLIKYWMDEQMRERLNFYDEEAGVNAQVHHDTATWSRKGY